MNDDESFSEFSEKFRPFIRLMQETRRAVSLDANLTAEQKLLIMEALQHMDNAKFFGDAL